MRILLVDDDFTSRKLLLKILFPLGECDLACNGKEAWEAYQSAITENAPYQLILLDIMMPEMDGNECLRLIRLYEKENNLFLKKAVKIAMATSLTDKGTIIDSFREQCDGYIMKPYTRESVLSQLKKFDIFVTA